MELSQNVKAMGASTLVSAFGAVVGGVVGTVASMLTGNDVSTGTTIGTAIGGYVGAAVPDEMTFSIPVFTDIEADNCNATTAGSMIGFGITAAAATFIGAAFGNANLPPEASEDVSILKTCSDVPNNTSSASRIKNSGYQMKLSNGCHLVSV